MAEAKKTESKSKPSAKGAKGRKKVERKNIAEGVVHVFASFNNTIITITDKNVNAIASCSAGAMGFKGSLKSTPYAAQVTAEEDGKKAQEHGLREVDVTTNRPMQRRRQLVLFRAQASTAHARLCLYKD
jgi:small subunit ribosomal protein S11